MIELREVTKEYSKGVAALNGINRCTEEISALYFRISVC